MVISGLSAMAIAMILAPGAAVSPSPSPTPRALKTIITVISSPACNSLRDHFNGALVPMLANDRTLDKASVQLDDLNTLFNTPNYEERFVTVRDTLGREEAVINQSLGAIQQEINALRDGAKLTTDPLAAKQIVDAADTLATAYTTQRQLAIDLHGMHQAMIDYPIMHVSPALGDFDPEEMKEPAEMKNVKSYLRFNGQRDIIDRNENKAEDIAYDVVQRSCTITTPATTAPPK